MLKMASVSGELKGDIFLNFFLFFFSSVYFPYCLKYFHYRPMPLLNNGKFRTLLTKLSFCTIIRLLAFIKISSVLRSSLALCFLLCPPILLAKSHSIFIISFLYWSLSLSLGLLVYLVECHVFWAPTTQLNEKNLSTPSQNKEVKVRPDSLKRYAQGCSWIHRSILYLHQIRGENTAHPMMQKKSQGTEMVMSQKIPSFSLYIPSHFV